jgi:TonB family protein
MHIILAYMFLSQIDLSKRDCGYSAHKAWIHQTEELIEKRAPLDIPTPELASGKGENECVRFEFHIDGSGHAINLSVKESTNELLMNMAAANALKKYKFRPPCE